MSLPFGVTPAELCVAVGPVAVAAVSWAGVEAAKFFRARSAQVKLRRQQDLLGEVEIYLLDGAANIAEKQFPVLAGMVMTGQLTTAAQVHAQLLSYGKLLKDQAITSFQGRGLDIVASLGEEQIDHLIETAANKASPLPGMKTSAALTLEPVAKAVVDKGVDYVRGHAQELVSLTAGNAAKLVSKMTTKAA